MTKRLQGGFYNENKQRKNPASVKDGDRMLMHLLRLEFPLYLYFAVGSLLHMDFYS